MKSCVSTTAQAPTQERHVHKKRENRLLDRAFYGNMSHSVRDMSQVGLQYCELYIRIFQGKTTLERRAGFVARVVVTTRPIYSLYPMKNKRQ